MKNSNIEARARADVLADYLGELRESVKPQRGFDEIETPSGVFMVLTDGEAQARAQEYITETLWAFRPGFLARFIPLNPGTIKAMQEALEESANPAFLAMLKDLNRLCFEAIQEDGRGHFIASYDGEEIKLPGGLYAYRIN